MIITLYDILYVTAITNSYHMSSYRYLDVDKFILKTKQYVLIGIICIMVSMYLGLGLALSSKLPGEIAYSLPCFPFFFIFFELFRRKSKNTTMDSS